MSKKLAGVNGSCVGYSARPFRANQLSWVILYHRNYALSKHARQKSHTSVIASLTRARSAKAATSLREQTDEAFHRAGTLKNEGSSKTMVITSAAQALAWLNNTNEEPAYREAAVRYLKDNLVPGAIARLVQALQDDELGVRWEAALALSQLGELAVPEVLIALVDPKRVGDPRLRAGAYHVLRDSHLTLPSGTAALLEALKGPAADIATMIEANRLLIQIEKQRARQGREFSRPGSTKARPPMPSSAPEMRYGLAQLTGRLRRLKKYRSI